MTGGLNRLKDGKFTPTRTRRACRATGSGRSTRTARARSGWAREAPASTGSRTASSPPTRRRTGSPATSSAPSTRTAHGRSGSAPGGSGLSREGRRPRSAPSHARTGCRARSSAVMYRDRAGTLWVGTDDGGLVAVREGRSSQVYGTRDGLSVGDGARHRRGPRREPVGRDRRTAASTVSPTENSRPYTTADGLSDNTVLSLYEDSDGCLWIGTDGGGLNRLRRTASSRRSLAKTAYSTTCSTRSSRTAGAISG